MKVLKRSEKRDVTLRNLKMILLSLFLVAAVPSCSKGGDDDDEDEDPVGEYYVTFDANGTSIKFTSDHFPLGGFYDDGRQYTGFAKATAPASSVNITVYDNKSINANSQFNGYSLEGEYPITAIGAVLIYQDGQNYFASPYENSNVVVKITKLTATSITGTFSGTLKSEKNPDLVIKNGKFHVPVGTTPV